MTTKQTPIEPEGLAAGIWKKYRHISGAKGKSKVLEEIASVLRSYADTVLEEAIRVSWLRVGRDGDVNKGLLELQDRIRALKQKYGTGEAKNG